jgi:hypothetical protein
MLNRSGSRRGGGSWFIGFAAVLICCLTAGGAGRSEAARIRLTADFGPPSVRTVESGAGIVEMAGCVPLGAPGNPLLPTRKMIVLLPPGEKVLEVRVSASPEQALDGSWQVTWAQTPQPMSLPAPFVRTLPNQAIYESDAPFPAERGRLITEETLSGHRIAFLQLYPVLYRAESGRLSWSDHISVEVVTTLIDGVDPARIANLRQTPEVNGRIAALVDNPEELSLYGRAAPAGNAGTRLDAGSYPYVIITTAEMAPAYQALALFEASRGMHTKIVLLDEITADYPGVDAAEQVRNFVIDAYQTWGVEYIMLGGDSNMIPVRNLYCDAGGTIDSFPGDCYYEALDGTWDDDHDGVWGEPAEADLAGELAVGRITARNAADLNNWLHKNEMYTDRPVVPEIQKALFMGERMDDVPTYSGIYMDDVKDYCCDWGYCTSGYPNSYLKQTLYDSPTYTWGPADAIAMFNSGFPTSHHLGHSNTTYGMKMSNPDALSFTNDGVSHSYVFMSTQGCYSNNFDNADTPSISEAFVLDDHCAVAFLGCTRYGWYCPGYDIGPSQHYDRQQVDARYGEGFVTAGWANVDSKIDNIWQMDPWNRWCHYEICLLGDPAMPQWNILQGQLVVTHDAGYVMGQGAMTVTVTCDGQPVAGATVSIYSDDLDAWASAVSNAQGIVTLDPAPVDPFPLRVKAVKPDYLPGTGDIAVDPGMQAWLEWDATTLDDDMTGPSVGDADGMADRGETAQFMVRLRNIGHVAAQNVTALITTDDPRVEILDPTASYGVIDGMGYQTNADDILVRVTDSIADGDVIPFSVRMTCDNRHEWTGAFNVTLHAPIFSLASWSIDDTAEGDGDGKIEPGERFAIRVSIGNSGSDQGRDIQGQLSSTDPYLTILSGTAGHPSIPAGGGAELEPLFQALLEPPAPTESFVPFAIAITTWCGQTFEASFEARVQSYVEEPLEVESGWTVGAPGDNATQGAWVRVDPNGTWRSGNPVQPEDDHSPDGAACFVTGQGAVGGTANYSDVDAGTTTLTSPTFDTRGSVNPKLVYWRWYTNNLAQFPNLDTWQVDISSDGGASWISLESTTASNNSWVRMEFNLDGIIQKSANVKLRFIASDLGYDSLVEAAIDDLSIENQPLPMDAGEGAAPLVFALHRISPNPCASARGGITIGYDLPKAGAVSLRVYDVTGALARTLVEGAGIAGSASVAWDGRDDAGRAVPAGVYFARLRGPGGETVRKVTILSAR